MKHAVQQCCKYVNAFIPGCNDELCVHDANKYTYIIITVIIIICIFIIIIIIIIIIIVIIIILCDVNCYLLSESPAIICFSKFE
jgi:hypothetical protein